MNVLCIGNSFSVDATRYLHRLARSAGAKITTVNLYIGGCDLETHYRMMLSKKKAYRLFINGEDSGFDVSMEEALFNRRWDVITFQQASHRSFDFESYEPYLSKLAEYVRLCSPKAKFFFHQTWAYEDGSPRLFDVAGFEKSGEMFCAIEKAASLAAKSIDAQIIPCGEVINKLNALETARLWRDGFHLSHGAGRYAAALTWYRVLTQKDVKDVVFSDFDDFVSSEDIKTVKSCVDSVNL